MVAVVRVVLFVVAALSYAATGVGLYYRSADEPSPRLIEPRGLQRKGAGDYSPGPVPLSEAELVDLRAALRDHAARAGK